MFLLLLLLVVVEERLRALRGEVRREGARALAALGSAGSSPNGGNHVIRGTTRRRHAANQLLMLQNPHRQPASCATSPTRPGRRADWREKIAQHGPFSSISAKKLAQHGPSSGISAKKFAQQAQKRRFWGVLSVQGELFRARAHHQATQGELFRAHGATTWRR